VQRLVHGRILNTKCGAVCQLRRIWAERWAAPEPARLAMCLRLDAESIAAP